MSDPKDPRKNHLKRKFEELPDQVTIADHPRNKRYGGLRLEFMISCYQININLISADGSSINIVGPSSTPPTLISPSSTIGAADIAMPVTGKIHSNLPAPK